MSEKTLASDPVNLQQLLSADNELQCPLFQRPYVWRQKNIDQLWADIDSIRETEFEARFLGALVFDNEFSSTARHAGLYWIIDGQQRLTSLYLALVAVCEVANEAGDHDFADELAQLYLLSRKSGSAGSPKLRPTLNDTRQFNKIILAALEGRANLDLAHEAGPSDGALRSGYDLTVKHVRRRCVDQGGVVNKHQLHELSSVLLDNLEFIEIRLGDKHDANEVFDRLNKEGERLGIIDLVRNEALKRLRKNPSDAQNLYAQYWAPFESSFESKKALDQYFFPFALTRDSAITKSRTFSTLARRWSSKVKEISDPVEQLREIMLDLGDHVGAYNAVASGKPFTAAGKGVAEGLRRLHDLNCPTVAFPYIMQIATAAANDDVESVAATECLLIIESFLVRRAFLGLEPTGLHAVFKALWGSVGAHPSRLRAALNTATISYPSNAEFRRSVISAKLYRKRIAKYVLGEFERSYTKGDVLTVLPDITIDHVLPQNPDGDWLEAFKNHEREKWVDTWANLVPLSGKANSERGRSSWKKTRERLGNETVFATTKHLLDNYEVWTVSSLKKRAGELADWAIKRWP